MRCTVALPATSASSRRRRRRSTSRIVGRSRALTWRIVGRPRPSVAPLEPSIAPTAGHGTTPRSFVSRSSVSGTPGARSTRLDSAREQAPRRCCLPLAAAHASSLGHHCTPWFFLRRYGSSVHVVYARQHIVISGRVLLLMGRGECELRVGAGRLGEAFVCDSTFFLLNFSCKQ